MKKKKSTALLISMILGVGYSLYLIAYFAGVMGGSKSGAEAVGATLATALVTPHMACVVVAAIFNVVGWMNNKRGFALTGAILYCVAGVLFLPYILFVIPSLILSFVGFARLKKITSDSTVVTA